VPSSTLVVVNPVAGRGRALRVRPVALGELESRLGRLRVVETKGPGEAEAAARQAAGGPRVIVIGGDGTLREVATALAGTGTPLGLIPAGSGNDLARSLGLSVDPLIASRVAAQGRARPIDVIRVTYEDAGGRRETISVNVAGLGFDARVSQAACTIPLLRGRLLYAAAILRAMRHLQPIPVRLTHSNGAFATRALLVAVANGPAFGGGLRIAPDALTDDGALDVCAVDAMSLPTMARSLPRLLNGTHVRLPQVRMLRTSHLVIECDADLATELDGDIIVPRPPLRVTFDCWPGALRIATGDLDGGAHPS
jgi:diacylglycerol kinase (ATP)